MSEHLTVEKLQSVWDRKLLSPNPCREISIGRNEMFYSRRRVVVSIGYGTFFSVPSHYSSSLADILSQAVSVDQKYIGGKYQYVERESSESIQIHLVGKEEILTQYQLKELEAEKVVEEEKSELELLRSENKKLREQVEVASQSLSE